MDQNIKIFVNKCLRLSWKLHCYGNKKFGMVTKFFVFHRNRIFRINKIQDAKVFITSHQNIPWWVVLCICLQLEIKTLIRFFCPVFFGWVILVAVFFGSSDVDIFILDDFTGWNIHSHFTVPNFVFRFLYLLVFDCTLIQICNSTT